MPHHRKSVLGCLFFILLLIQFGPHATLSRLLLHIKNVQIWDGKEESPSLLRRDGVPSSPPWMLPSWLTSPPTCINTLDTCPWNGGLIASCTSQQCSKSLFGGCMEYDPMVDLSCVCPQLSANDCSCGTGIEKYFSLSWLNTTCSFLSNWTGLPANWENILPVVDLIPLANASTDYYPELGPNSVPDYSSYDYQPSGIFSYWFPPEYRIPTFGSGSCGDFAFSRLQNSTLNATEAYVIGSNASWSQISTISTSTSGGLFLDRISFCTSSYQQIPGDCRQQDPDQTMLLLWYQNLCQDVTTKWGWPSDWEASLVLYNSSTEFLSLPSRGSPPSCVASQPCYQVFNSSQEACATSVCIMGAQSEGQQYPDGYGGIIPYPVAGVPQGYNCTATPVTYNKSCACAKLSYGTTCNSSCQLSWERADYLNWINSSCSSVSGWNGLPSDWTSLLEVQENELLPWHWRIQQNNPSSLKQCASTEAKLGAFAAVNIVMAIVTPILGRRDVMKKLSLGLCGHRGSKLWMLTGPLTVLLHILSNAVAAAIIKHTPGYSGVNIGALILLWCTRPRLAWLVVVLLPWGAKDFIYFSVAASTLLAEIILQLIGSAYMGSATQYARQQKFYQKGRLTNTPHGQDAWVMYAGSLLWLTVIVFAVIACILSVFNIDRQIASFVGTFLKGEKKKMRKRRARCQVEIVKNNRCIALAQSFEASQSAAVQKLRLPITSEEYEVLSQRWHDMAERWDKLVQYVDIDLPAFRKQEKRLGKMKKKLEKGSASGNESFRAEFQIATQRFRDNEILLGNTPKEAIQALNSDEADFTAKHSQAIGRHRAAVEHTRAIRNRTPYAFDTFTGTVLSSDDRITQEEEEEEAIQHIESNLTELEDGWQHLNDTFLQPLVLFWGKQEQARQKEEAERNRDSSEKLKRIAMTTVVGMFGCWVAQWVWWIGYVRVAADSYCPPKLSQIALTWIVFSVLGAVFGASF